MTNIETDLEQLNVPKVSSSALFRMMETEIAVPAADVVSQHHLDLLGKQIPKFAFQVGSLPSMKESHDVSAGSSVDSEGSHISEILLLRQDEEKLRRLRFAFLELETKRRFLDALLVRGNDHTQLCPSEERYAETELNVAHSKAKLKKVKNEAIQSRTTVDRNIEKLANLVEETMEQEELGTLMQTQLRSVIAQQILVSQFEEKQFEDGASGMAEDWIKMLDHNRGAPLRERLIAQKGQREQENLVLQGQIRDLKSKVELSQSTKNELSQQLVQLQENEKERAPLTGEKAEMVQKCQKMEMLLKALGSLGGISMITFGDGLLTLKLLTAKAIEHNVLPQQGNNDSSPVQPSFRRDEHLLEIMFQPDDTTIHAALLTPQSVPVQDLVKAFRNDIFHFILQVQLRLLR